MARLLEVRGAEVVFSSGFGGREKKRALSGVTIAAGGIHPSVTAIVGESGSGKTTLIRVLLGFQPPTRGEVVYDGTPLQQMTGGERAQFRREVQAIFQDPFDAFNPFYRVDHPLLAPLKTFGLATRRDEAYARIERTLKSVGLEPAQTLGRFPHQLSGGQRQRVMIARALLLEPQIILADEPVSMVDASLRSTILDILYGLNRDLGISIIYVTHDLTTAYQVADSIVVLHGGQIMEVGAAEKVIHDPQHSYTRALISAVPSPDPAVPWDLDEKASTPSPPAGEVVLYRTEPLRAVAGRRQGDQPVTAAEIQLEVSRARAAAA
jgi:peptide/nickel transport system ATP-binding protein